MNSFGKYAGAQHRTPEYFYTAGIHLDISRRNSQNQEKFVNEIEYSYSAPPLENFKDIEYICGSFEKLMNSYTENLPKQIRVILYGAWIDPNFVNARNNKLINLHHFTEIEFALIVEVAKILNDKIPDTVAVLLLMIMGREDKPTVVPKIWPEHVKRMKPLEEEIVSDCGPYNVTSKILLNLLESLNPNRSLVMYRKFEFKKDDNDEFICNETNPEKKFINSTELFKILNIKREVPNSPLSFHNTVDREIYLFHYNYNKCNWFIVRSKNFCMAWGDDASLGCNMRHGPVPWVNIVNDKIPPTLPIPKEKFPAVKWKPDATHAFEYHCEFCPKNYPNDYQNNFIKELQTEYDDVEMNISIWDGTEFKKPKRKHRGKPRVLNNILFVWPDKNGNVPLANLLNSGIDNIGESLCIVECTDQTCPDPNCPYKITKNLVSPKVSLAFFPDKEWSVIAEEFIKSDKLLFLYQGDTFNEDNKSYDDNYTFQYYIGNSNPVSIDASRTCNASRFINHACYDEIQRFPQPNCTAFNITSATYDFRIAIFSARDIYPGEELTLNYKNVMKDKICSCNRCKQQRNKNV